MNRNVPARLFFLAILTVGVSVLALGAGASDAGLGDLFGGDEVARRLLIQVRLPRVLLALLVGAALSTAGVASQSLLGTPLADPFTLGISGGAALGAALASATGGGGMEIASLVGSAVAALLVFAAARRTGRLDTARLLLAGLVANALFSAAILLALSLSRGDALRGMVFWMMGSLGAAELSGVLRLLPLVAAGLVLLALAARPLDLFLAGEESAASLGVDVERTKLAVFAAVALVTAGAVAGAGIIGFVGLLVPHGARAIVGPAHRGSLPAAALLGGGCVVLADLAARTVVAPSELPIGALSALVGAPLFLWLVFRR